MSLSCAFRGDDKGYVCDPANPPYGSRLVSLSEKLAKLSLMDLKDPQC